MTLCFYIVMNLMSFCFGLVVGQNKTFEGVISLYRAVGQEKQVDITLGLGSFLGPFFTVLRHFIDQELTKTKL